jgi:hypothetical protein
MRCAGGDVEDAEGAISTYDGLSWGAGDGAIAMAVLMMLEGGGSEWCSNWLASDIPLRLGDFLPLHPILVLCVLLRYIGFVRLVYLPASCLTRDLVPPNQSELLLAANYCCFSRTGKMKWRPQEDGPDSKFQSSSGATLR